MTKQEKIMRDVADMDVPDFLNNLVSYRIRLLQIASYKAFEQKVSGFGSAPRYFGMLKLIEANPGIPQTRLAEAIYLDRSSLVPILEALSREGWVERKPAVQDKRVRLVFLSDWGKTQLTALEEQVIAHEALATAGISKSEKSQLLGLLGRIDDNLRKLHETGTE